MRNRAAAIRQNRVASGSPANMTAGEPIASTCESMHRIEPGDFACDCTARHKLARVRGCLLPFTAPCGRSSLARGPSTSVDGKPQR